MTDVRQLLAEIGTEPVEPVEPRLAELEKRLLAAIEPDGGKRPAALLPISDQPRHPIGRRVLLTAAACILAIAVGVVFLLPSRQDGDVVITAADDVVVVRANGEVLDGEAGVALMNGERIDVVGFVEVDGQRFGPGSYVVDDGELVVVASEPATTDHRATPLRPETTRVSAPAAEAPTSEPPSTPPTTVVDGDAVVRPVATQPQRTTLAPPQETTPARTVPAPVRTTAAEADPPPATVRPPTTANRPDSTVPSTPSATRPPSTTAGVTTVVSTRPPSPEPLPTRPQRRTNGSP